MTEEVAYILSIATQKDICLVKEDTVCELKKPEASAQNLEVSQSEQAGRLRSRLAF